MDQRALQSFLVLAEALHFGRAADACHMSPSTLSRAIKQLETALGVRLFERDNRSVTLTSEGEVFRRYAREAVALWEALENSLMEETRELSGEIAMYCSVTASYSYLFDLLSAFRQRHPRIRIRLQTGDPEQAMLQVQSGAAQISIGARPERLPGALLFKSITATPLVFIAPRSSPDATSPANVRGNVDAWGEVPPDLPDDIGAWGAVPMILPESGVARERIAAWFRGHGMAPRVWAQVAGNEAIVSMVSLGAGVGVVPRIVLDNSPLAGRVRVLAVRPQLEPLEVGLFALKKSLHNRLLGALWAAAG